MADTDTTPLAATDAVLVKPELGGSADSWGLKSNNNWDAVAAALNETWDEVGGRLAVSNNLSDVANATSARGNLGLAIGSQVQAHDALLTSIAGLNFVTGSFIYGIGTDAAAVGTVTTFARSILDDTDAGEVRTTLGLVIGTNVQAYSATLTSLAGASANGVSLVTAANYAAMRDALNLRVGVELQAHHGNLAALSLLTLSANQLPYATGAGSMALAGFTDAGRDLVGAASAAVQRGLLGLGNVENKSAATILGELNSTQVTTALGHVPTSITSCTGVQSASAVKTALSLNAVENKSSATIRGELTAANVNAALGKTAARVAAGSGGNSGLISWGAGEAPSLAEGEIYLRHA